MRIKTTLVLTCSGCPEQYELRDESGKEIAVFRLRNGAFRVDCYGKTIYEAEPNADGIFDIDERAEYLYRALTAVKNYLSVECIEVEMPSNTMTGWIIV